jgi:hypothetical protein
LSFLNIGYIDPTGRVKVVPFDMDLEDYEIDILSPIEGTYLF